MDHPTETAHTRPDDTLQTHAFPDRRRMAEISAPQLLTAKLVVRRTRAHSCLRPLAPSEGGHGHLHQGRARGDGPEAGGHRQGIRERPWTGGATTSRQAAGQGTAEKRQGPGGLGAPAGSLPPRLHRHCRANSRHSPALGSPRSVPGRREAHRTPPPSPGPPPGSPSTSAPGKAGVPPGAVTYLPAHNTRRRHVSCACLEMT